MGPLACFNCHENKQQNYQVIFEFYLLDYRHKQSIRVVSMFLNRSTTKKIGQIVVLALNMRIYSLYCRLESHTREGWHFRTLDGECLMASLMRFWIAFPLTSLQGTLQAMRCSMSAQDRKEYISYAAVDENRKQG